MVNYTVYQNITVASEQRILKPYEFEGVNTLLFQTFIQDHKDDFSKKLDQHLYSGAAQIQKMVEEYNQWFQEINKHIAENPDPNVIYEPLQKIFIPIKTAEKLPLRSELSQNEFKCLTLKESLEKDNWILQYLSGHYHKKSQTFYVKMLGDSYTIEAMYRVILLKGLMKGKYIEYLK